MKYRQYTILYSLYTQGIYTGSKGCTFWNWSLYWQQMHCCSFRRSPYLLNNSDYKVTVTNLRPLIHLSSFTGSLVLRSSHCGDCGPCHVHTWWRHLIWWQTRVIAARSCCWFTTEVCWCCQNTHTHTAGRVRDSVCVFRGWWRITATHTHNVPPAVQHIPPPHTHTHEHSKAPKKTRHWKHVRLLQEKLLSINRIKSESKLNLKYCAFLWQTALLAF